MARLIENNFDPAKPLVVRRFFVAAGRHFKIGDDFDWRRLSVDQRRVKQLFDIGKLMHPAQATAQRPAPAPNAVTPVIEPALETALEPAIEPAIEPDTLDTTAPEVVAESATPDDGLGRLNMKELRKIAYAEGAASRTSRAEQAEAIREHRSAT